MTRKVFDAPAYRIAEAAALLRLPVATLRSWVAGRAYPVANGMAHSLPVIEMSDPARGYLSFNNLVEAHVLSAIRRERVTLAGIRDAVQFLREGMNSQRPLLEQQFATDGVSLFIERLGQLVNVTRKGQLSMREVLGLYLRRIERNPKGIPVRLYPFTHSVPEDRPAGVIVIDPSISFGRPALARLGVPTAVIADRYKAGENIDDLASDYGAERNEIEEAIRCELPAVAA